MPEPLIPVFDVRMGEPEIDAVVATLRSGWLTMGPETERFERAFAEHLGVRHAVAVSSGTAALHLAYLAAGAGPGTEVIVPAITFVATANTVRHCGATPVFADIRGQHDLGIDPDEVEARITPRTRAVCAVHYAGYPAAVERLREICEARGLALVEDAAHSPSATPRGLAGAFSFFSTKVLACGEGGLLATDDDRVAEMGRALRSHGMTSTTWDRHRGQVAGYDVTAVGFNYRIDEARAALLNAGLLRLEGDIAQRRRVVHRYRELLATVEGLTVPYDGIDVDGSACYAMPVMVDRPEVRDDLRALLERRGIQTTVLYPAVHELAAYAGTAEGRLPRSELAARTQLTLPLYPHLAAEDQERVVAALDSGLRELLT